MSIDNPTTIESLIAIATGDVDEWMETHDDVPSAEVIDGFAQDATPVMTSILFKLVVLDNTLAFVDSSTMSSEPFAVLYAAVKDRIAEAVQNHVDYITEVND
jgi:hypothetical protein